MKKYKITSLPKKLEGGPKVKQRRGVRKNLDGTVSSHLMRAEYIPEKGWVGFPSLFQDSKPYADDQQNWVDMSEEEDWMKVYEEAERRGEVYDFGEDKEAALAFGEGSWKDQLPQKKDGGLPNLDLIRQKGGVIKIPTKRSGGQYNRRVLNDLDRFLVDPYRSKKYSKSLAATNSVFAVNDLFKKPARSRIYNPNARYLQEGGELPKAMFGKGLGKFFRKNNIQTSLGFGNTAPHLNNYVPKVGINTIMGQPRKGFLDLGLTAGGDKKGFAGNLDATYYGPFMGGNRHFQGLIDSDTYYDQGTVGQSFTGGGNWIGGSRNIGNKRKDALRKGDWSTEGGIGLQIGAYKDLNAPPVPYYEQDTSGGAPLLKYKPSTVGIDFGPKAHFRFQKSFGNNLTLDAKASIVADLVKNSTEGAAQGNTTNYVYEYIDNPDAPNYTNVNQTIQGNSILSNTATEERFRPEFKPSAEVKLTYNIPTGGSLFGGRKKGKTPDELDEEISVKERKPKPEKEIKPKKEPKPIIVKESARHPRWLQDGGELPKHNFTGIVKKAANSAKKNPVMKKFLRYMDGVDRGANEILRNPLSSRKFSEIFPITQAQKIASDNLQEEAMFQGDDFIKKWTYGRGPSSSQTDIPYIPRAGVEKKIRDIFLSLDQPTTGPIPGPYAGLDLGKFHDNFLIHHGYPKPKQYGWDSLQYNKDNPFVEQKTPHLIGSEIFNSERAQELIPKIGKSAINYLQDNYEHIGGVNFNAGPSVTLKDRGPYRIDPGTIKEVGAHEGGHTMQKLGYYINSSQQPMGWSDVLETYNPDIKTSSGKQQGYNVADPNTALGKRFKDAMVEDKYWKSSPSELHSELMVSRMNAFNTMKKDPAYANFSDDQIMEIMQLDEPEMLNYIYDTPSSYGESLGRFFKKETPLQERLDLMKLLPGLAVPFALPGLMDSQENKKKGGVIKIRKSKLNKFKR